MTTSAKWAGLVARRRRGRPRDTASYGVAGTMSRLSLAALAVVALVSIGVEVAGAQERGAVLLLQPGMLSADFASAPAGYPSTSGFNLRFSTIVPTASKWWTLIVGASVTPYGTSGITPRSSNAPVLFIGNIFPGIPARRTGGWFDVQFPAYFTYSYGGGGPHNVALYGRDFVGEAALQLFVGDKMLRDLGPAFSRLRLYLMLNQVLTPNEDPSTGSTDRFSPIALYGITIPVGGRGSVRGPAR